MGDPRRFDRMADAVANLWPDRDLRIADVAAGKGGLRAALYQRGYRDVTCIDRRAKKAQRPYYRYQHLDSSVKVRGVFDLLLGMHPDEATDVIAGAVLRGQGALRGGAVLCPSDARLQWRALRGMGRPPARHGTPGEICRRRG